MFRDYDLRYLVPYVLLLWALTGLDIWYEVSFRTEDSWPETAVSVGQGIGSAVAVTFLIFATVEGMAYMVIAMARLRKLRRENEEKQEEARKKGLEEGREEGRQEERQRWEAWAMRAEEARATGQTFDEPPPAP